MRTVLSAALAVVTGALLVMGTTTALRLGQDDVLPVAGVAGPDAPPTWPVPVLPTDIADEPDDRSAATAEPVRERTRAPERTRVRSRTTTTRPPPATTAPVPTPDATTGAPVPDDDGADPAGDDGGPVPDGGGTTGDRTTDDGTGSGRDDDGPPVGGVVRDSCELLAC